MVDLSLINKTANGYELRVVDDGKKHTFDLTAMNLAGIVASISLIIRDSLVAPTTRGGKHSRLKAKTPRPAVPAKRGPGRPRKVVPDGAKLQHDKPRRSSRVRPAKKYSVSKRGRVPAPKRK